MSVEEITIIVAAPEMPREEGDDFEEQVFDRVFGDVRTVSVEKVRKGLDNIKGELETLLQEAKQKLSGAAKPETIAIGVSISGSGSLGIVSAGAAVSLQLIYKI